MNKTKDYNPYVVIDRNFAFGGNGNLYLVKDENEIKYVLKILKIHSAKDVKKVKRFLNEIKFVEEYQDEIQGIIPIRFTYIPEELKSEFEFTADLKGTELWYVMDLAEPIAEKLGETRDLEMIIESLISLSQTLAELHSHIIVHRDIKPSNLYYYKDTWAFGDFGLVAYPEIDDKNLTGKDERIGNYATIAPEMRRGGLVEDARPADVWSLAKTLWMLITYNDSSCFEGSYSRNVEEISVSRYLKGVPTDLLHNILECASRYEPKNRVDIKEFLRMLEGYRDLLSDKKRIFSYKELQVLSHQSEEGRFFHNSADRTVATDQLIKNFNLILENQEYYFRTQQLDDEVDILKYIKYKLEFFSLNSYLISPIIGHHRNTSLPAIRIFVRYTDTEAKFVSDVVCLDKKVHLYQHRIPSMENYYDEDERVDYTVVNDFVKIIDSISMKSNESLR